VAAKYLTRANLLLRAKDGLMNPLGKVRAIRAESSFFA